MLLALLAWVWVAGSALARDRPASERFAVGALAACGLAWTAMVAGALGVGLLGSTLATAGLALAAAAVFLALRPPLRAPRPAVAPLVTGCVAGLVLSAPQLALSLGALQPSRGDLLWHLGWIHQLEDGAATPGGVYAGEPNGYPWLFHALVAWIAGALPGGAESAVWAMQGFGLACAGTGIWLLAMEICDRRRAATWSVGLFLAAASLGWAADAHGHRFDMATIDAGPFHGSPVPALTPATTFLPPMIPRDLGLALVPIVLWLALRAISGRVRDVVGRRCRRRPGVPDRPAGRTAVRRLGGGARGHGAPPRRLAGGAGGSGRGGAVAGSARARLPPLPRLRPDHGARMRARPAPASRSPPWA